MKFLKNPFKNEETEEAKQLHTNRENEILNSAVSPQNEDEKLLIEQREKYADLRKWQQDRKPTHIKLFYRLCGYDIDGDGKIDNKKTQGIMSEIGARRMIDFIEALDVNVMMGNWSSFDKRNTLYCIGTEIKEHLLARTETGNYNYRVYEIKKENVKYCWAIIFNEIQATFQRGWNNGERQLDSKIQKSVETKSIGNDNKPRGVFGM